MCVTEVTVQRTSMSTCVSVHVYTRKLFARDLTNIWRHVYTHVENISKTGLHLFIYVRHV